MVPEHSSSRRTARTVAGAECTFFAIAVGLDDQGHIDPSMDLQMIVFEGEATHVVPAPGASVLVLLGSGLLGLFRSRERRLAKRATRS